MDVGEKENSTASILHIYLKSFFHFLKGPGLSSTFSKTIFFTLISAGLLGCTEGIPKFEDLGSQLLKPEFNEPSHLYLISDLTSDSPAISGTCDKNAEAIGMRPEGREGFDYVNTSSVASGSDLDCSDGTFSLILKEAGTYMGFTSSLAEQKSLFIQTKASNGITSEGEVFIRYLPEIPKIQWVNLPTTPTAESLVATLRVTITPRASFGASVNYATVQGTAIAADFTSVSGNLSFGTGDDFFDISISITGDTLYEQQEIFDVTLSSVVGAEVETPGASVTIAAGGVPPNVYIGNAIANEGSSLVFPISLSEVSGVDALFNFQNFDNTATVGDNDYIATSGLHSIPAGSLTTSLVVATGGDTKFELDETFYLSLSPANADVTVNTPGVHDLGVGTLLNNDTLPDISVLGDIQPEGTPIVFMVTLSSASPMNVTFSFNTLDGSALVSNTDYSTASGASTINAGSEFITVTIPTTADTLFENDETFLLTLSSVVGANVSSLGVDDLGVSTISNNDPMPTISTNDLAYNEGNVGAHNVVLDTASGIDAIFSYSLFHQTVQGSDYSVISASLLTIPAGSLATTISILGVSDGIDENNEFYRISLTGITGASSGSIGAQGTINDIDPTPTIHIDDVAFLEGNTIDAFVTLSAASGLDVSFNINFVDTPGEAAGGSDFIVLASQAVTLPAGAITHTFQVNSSEDLLNEPNETYEISLTSLVNAVLGDDTALVTIQNDDGLPPLSVYDSFGSEGSDLVMMASLASASGADVSFDWRTYNISGQAIGGVDYTLVALSRVTIPAGNLTIALTIPTANDSPYDEFDEAFLISLSNVSNASLVLESATGTIIDVDGPPTINLISPTAETEGSSLAFGLSLSAISGKVITVTLNSIDGSATDSQDYNGLSGNVYTLAINSQTLPVNVETLTDGLNEPSPENFLVSLTQVENAQMPGVLTVGGDINDADGPPSIYVGDAVVTEDNTAQVVVSLSELNGFPTTFDWNLLANTATDLAGDYTAASNQPATIPALQLNITLAIPTLDDGVDENSETFFVSLSSLNPQVLPGDVVGTVNINDNDPAPSLSILSAVAITEGQTSLFVLSLSGVSGKEISFNINTTDDTALQPQDYVQVVLTTLTIPVGSLTSFLQVTTNDELLNDSAASEFFNVTLTSPIDVILGAASAQGQILDNDLPPDIAILDTSGNENSSLFFMVTLSAVSENTVTFDYTTLNAEAVFGSDYVTIANAGIPISPGQVTAPIIVNALLDNLYDPGEHFTVSLTGTNANVITDGSGRGDIVDIDGIPSVFLQDASAISEGASSLFLVTMTHPSDMNFPISWTSSHGTTDSGDFTVSVAQAGQIPALETGITIAIATNDDVVLEATEIFNVSLYSVSGVATIVDGYATGVINDNEGAVTISVWPPAGNSFEGADLVFDVSLSGVSSFNVTFDYYTFDGSASIADGDYVDNDASQTITVGGSLAQITISSSADTKYESDEQVIVSISNVIGAVVQTVGSTDKATASIVNDDSPPLLFVDGALGAEGTTLPLVISLSEVSGIDTIFNYQTIDGTALFGSGDYVQVPLTQATIPLGQLTLPMARVALLADGLDEFSEILQVTLSVLSGASTGTLSNNVTITDTDAAPTISIFDLFLSESQTVNFVVSLSSVSAKGISFDYGVLDGTALVSSSDFISFSGDNSLIPAGFLAVTLSGANASFDGVYEGGEFYQIQLSDLNNVGPGMTLATVSISDLETQPSLSVYDISMTEAGSFDFVVSLSGAAGSPVTFNFNTLNGTASSLASDFSALSREGTIPAGGFSATLAVGVIDDSIYEPDEQFLVSLSNPSAAASISIATATGFIANNDSAPLLFVNDFNVVEGTTQNFIVSISTASEVDAVFSYQSFDIFDAVETTDYQALLGQETIAVGSTAVTLSALALPQDLIDETNETFQVSLVAISDVGAGDLTSVATIIDDDGPPNLYIADLSILEGSTAIATVSLSGLSGLDVAFDVTTFDGTATAGVDYIGWPGFRLTIPPSNLTWTFAITTGVDTVFESDETFQITLSNLSASAGVGDLLGDMTIFENDPMPNLIIANDIQSEGATFNFVVSLDALSGVDATFSWLTIDGEATTGDSDFTATSTQATIAAGDGLITLHVASIEDTKFESDENFYVSLFSFSNVTVSNPFGDEFATGTITNDDLVPSLNAFPLSLAEGSSGDVIVSLSQISGEDAVFSFVTLDGPLAGVPLTLAALSADSDYTAIGFTVATIPSGGGAFTIGVNAIADGKDEYDEVFVLSLASVQDVTVNTMFGVVTIGDGNAPSSIFIEDLSFNEGETGIMAVSLNSVSGKEIAVDFRTFDNSASAADYTAYGSLTPLTIPVGSLTASVSLVSTQDIVVEGNENFFVSLANATNGFLADDTGVATILDDDVATLSVADASAGIEGSTFNFVVSVTPPTGTEVTFSWNTENLTTLSLDYQVVGATVATIPAGQGSFTLAVLSNEDYGAEYFESAEQFRVTLFQNSANVNLVDGEALASIANDPFCDTGDLVTTCTVSELKIFDSSFTVPGTADFVVAGTGIISVVPGQTLGITITGGANDINLDIGANLLGNFLFYTDGDFTHNATMSASSMGDVGGSGLGAGAFNATAGGGGGHGGSGGSSSNATVGGSAHGNLSNPTAFGSGGGSTSSAVGGRGGGRVSIWAGGTAHLFGLIYANGQDGFVGGGTGAGGGAGGSVRVEASSIVFSGGIEALGGAGGGSTADGGGGGGGRIALVKGAGVLNSSGWVSVDGGMGPDAAADGAQGTYYTNVTSNLFVLPASAAEGSSLEFLVTLSQAQPVDVSFQWRTFDGSATIANDYSGSTSLISEFIPSGALSIAVTLPTLQDSLFENVETFTFSISNPSYGAIVGNSSTGSITNDGDVPPSISIADRFAVTEGSQRFMAVNLSAVSGVPTIFEWSTLDGTATAPGDYTAVVNQRVTIPIGSLTTAAVTLTTISDFVFEPGPNQIFNVQISTISGIGAGGDTNGVFEILDTDSAPTVVWGAPTVTEGSSLTFNFSLSHSVESDVGFAAHSFVPASGSPADAGGGFQDYTPWVSQVITFTAGNTIASHFLATTDDSWDEPLNETLMISLSAATQINLGTVGVNDIFTATITDNDSTPQIYISDVALLENVTPATLQVSVFPNSQNMVSLDWNTSNGSAVAGADYIGDSETLTFPSYSFFESITITIIDDVAEEPTETFNVNLSNPGDATISDFVGVVQINNDDSEPVLYISGTGGSTYGGISISSCGGNDICDSVTPYVVTLSETFSAVSLVNGAHMTTGAYAGGAVSINNGLLEIDVTGNFIIADTSRMSVTGGGYRPSDAQGLGAGAVSVSAGGSHAGAGGQSHYADSTFSSFGSYGSITYPTSLGGAALKFGTAVSPGGGAVHITVGGAMSIAAGAFIDANGVDSGVDASRCSGGGAGGSIYIQAVTLTGTGSLRAHGGDGMISNGNICGSGSGGRIALYFEESDVWAPTMSQFTLPLSQVDIEGGAAISGGHGSQNRGAGGTFYLDDTNDALDPLILIENSTSESDQSTPLSMSQNFERLYVRGGSFVEIPTDINIQTVLYDFSSSQSKLHLGGVLSEASPDAYIDFQILYNGGTIAGVLDPSSGVATLASEMIFLDKPLITGQIEIHPTLGRLTTEKNNGSSFNHVEISADFIDLKGVVSLTGHGHPADYGSGKGLGTTILTGNYGAGGGSYGGDAGVGSSYGINSPYGETFGSLTLGSGGGSIGETLGGAGGGYIRLSGLTVLISGDISANGMSGTSYSGIASYSQASGGGSGGAIEILASQTLTISASSQMEVNGGYRGVDTGQYGGMGSGGRIYIEAMNTQFIDNGAQFAAVQPGNPAVNEIESGGAPGTVVIRNSTTNYGNLIVGDFSPKDYFGETPLLTSLGSITLNTVSLSDAARLILPIGKTLDVNPVNFDFDHSNEIFVVKGSWLNSLSSITGHIVQINPTGLSFQSQVTISNNGVWEFGHSSNINSISYLNIANGGVLTHLYNGSTFNYKVDLSVTNIDIQGDISLSGKGYAPGIGPGAGDSVLFSTSSGGGGGGYGGRGGNGNDAYFNGGSTYDSITNPSQPGSGGGVNYQSNQTVVGGQIPQGAGGGVLRLHATNNIVIGSSAEIKANGKDDGSSTYKVGCGAGGSINITADTSIFIGATTVEANGAANLWAGGSGGGGRIRIESPTLNSFNSFNANKGLSPGAGNEGKDGTVYFGSGNVEFAYANLALGEPSVFNGVDVYSTKPLPFDVTLAVTPEWRTTEFPGDVELITPTIVMQEGETSALVVVNIVEDSIWEQGAYSDIFDLSLSSQNAQLSVSGNDIVTVSITDNESAVNVTVLPEATEENSSSLVILTLSHRAESPIQISFAQTGGTATYGAGSDFTTDPAAPGAVIIPALSWSSVVTLTANTLAGSRDADITWTPASAGLATMVNGTTNHLLIPSGVGELYLLDTVAMEGDSAIVILTLTGNIGGGTANMSLGLIDNTAISPGDYGTPIGNPLALDKTQAGFVAFTIPIPDDGDTVDLEYFTANVSCSASCAGTGAAFQKTSAVVTIRDRPQISFTVSMTSVSEGATAVNVVLNSTNPLPNASQVNLSYIDESAYGGIGKDYIDGSSVVDFPTNTTAITVAIPLVDNDLFEFDETFLVSIGSVTNGISGLPGTISISINDDDPIVVDPIYPANGSNWNDYVANNGTSLSDWLDDSDISCNATTDSGIGGPSQCFHGGEMRIVKTGLDSCTGYQMSDSELAFDWHCRDNEGSGPATFYSFKLRDNKKLVDLLSFTPYEFKDMRVTLTPPAPLSPAQSSLNEWWSNPVLPVSSASDCTTMTQPGAIYVFHSKLRCSAEIGSDQVSVVTSPTGEIQWDKGTSCSGGGKNCVLSASGYNFLWLEGNVDGTYNPGETLSRDDLIATNSRSDSAVYLDDSQFSVVRSLNVSGAKNSNLEIRDSSNLQISNIRLADSQILDADSGNLEVNNVDDSSFTKIRVASSRNSGIQISNGSIRNDFVQMLVSATEHYGLRINGSADQDNTFKDISIFSGNLESALYINLAQDNTFANIILHNNASNGIEISGGTGNVFSNIYMDNIDLFNISMVSATGTEFHGDLELDDASCISAGNIAVNSSCVKQVGSTGPLSTSQDLTASFEDTVPSDSNPSGVSSTYRNLRAHEDWSVFDNPFRSRAKIGSINAVNGACYGVAACVIKDFSLAKADAILRDRYSALSDASACPAELSGSSANEGVLLANGLSENFFTRAEERQGDGIGNENGICESHEACVQLIHVGLDQDREEWTYASKCNFTGASISGVGMYGNTSYDNWDLGNLGSGWADVGAKTLQKSSAGTGNARTMTSKSSGQHYFEFKVVSVGSTPSFFMIGVGPSATANNIQHAGVSGAVALYGNGTFKEDTSSTIAYAPALSNGDIVGFAVDIDTNQVWISINGQYKSGAGTTAGDWVGSAPSTFGEITLDAAGAILPMISVIATSTNSQVQSQFNASELSYTPPAGYTAGWTK